MLSAKEGLGKGKWSCKEAKEAQGVGPDTLYLLAAQGTQGLQEEAGDVGGCLFRSPSQHP